MPEIDTAVHRYQVDIPYKMWQDMHVASQGKVKSWLLEVVQKELDKVLVTI